MTSRRTPDDWRNIIDQYHASGLKVSEFCRQNNITPSNFYLWRKKLFTEPTDAQEHDSNFQTADNWQLINPQQETNSWDIELTLPGGVTLRMRQN